MSRVRLRIMTASRPDPQPVPTSAGCCPLYHEAIELIGKRWTGAALQTLMEGPLRFSEIKAAIPDISDRLLSQRMKELEERGLVARTVRDSSPVRVDYELTDMGHELAPALAEIKAWANRWLKQQPKSWAAAVPQERTAAPTGKTALL